MPHLLNKRKLNDTLSNALSDLCRCTVLFRHNEANFVNVSQTRWKYLQNNLRFCKKYCTFTKVIDYIVIYEGNSQDISV